MIRKMTSHSPISDEMLARYMCSSSLPGEAEQVESWLSESDENLEAFRSMSQAVALQRKAWSGMDSSPVKKPILSPRVFYWAVAACLLLLVGGGLLLLRHGGSPLQIDPVPATAASDSVCPTTDTIIDIQLPCHE